MNTTAFYGVVSAINFTLLGLWWVAIKERDELRDRSTGGHRMAYIVSLQFLIPGTISLLSQVAPDEPVLWRTSFTVAGLAGAAGMLLLAPALGTMNGRTVSILLRAVVVPVYLVVALVAAIPPLTEALRFGLTPLQIEALLLCALVFLGVQSAWAVAMAPRR